MNARFTHIISCLAAMRGSLEYKLDLGGSDLSESAYVCVRDWIGNRPMTSSITLALKPRAFGYYLI